MTRVTILRGAGLAASACALLLLSACTSGATTPTAAGTTGPTAPSTSSAPTSVGTPTAPTLPPPTFGPGQSLTRAQMVSVMQGTYPALSTVHIEVNADLGGGGGKMTMSGDADYSAAHILVSGSMSAPRLSPQPIKIVLTGKYMYMDFGTITADKYVAFSLKKLGSGDPSSVTDSFDPRSMFDKATSAITKSVYVGPDTVNGETAYHYAVTVSVRKLLKAEPDFATGSGKKNVTKYESLKTAPFEDIWVGADGHLVKVVTHLLKLNSSIVFSNYGAPVSITTPPPSQVTRIPSLS